MLEHAIQWAERGFRVFPITEGEKIPPKGMAWKTEASSDPVKIHSWWAFNPNYNFGVATGGGVLVVDIDAGKNGYAALLELDLPATLTVKTPGGGIHLYYTGPDVQNSVDRVAPGVDVRSEGGYVIGPGSVFLDSGGKKGYKGSYTVEFDSEMTAAPETLLLRCGTARERNTAAALSVDTPDDIIYAVHYLLKEAPLAVEGRGGNNTTYAVAARVVEIGVSANIARDLMVEHWNDRCSPAWDAEELLVICQNAERYAQKQQGSGGVSAQLAEFGGSVALPSDSEVAESKFKLVFSKRTLTPLAEIPARAWVAHRLLLRNETTVLSGPGGVGKSGFSLALAAHGATGRPFAGYDIPRPFKSIVYNLEDSRHEMEARLYATCATYNMDINEVEKHILLWPGREQRFKLTNTDHTMAMADIKELARLTKSEGFDAIVLDPLVSLHDEEESNNVAMGKVMDAINGLARMANVAVLALHHTPKGVRQAGSSDAVRGAGNIVNSVRIASTIYAADETDATLYGFGDDFRGRYVRIDDAKQNVSALVSKPAWLEKWSYPLPNGDTVQALRPVETSVQSAGEAKLIATVIASHMDRCATMHLNTHDAAKVLVDAEVAFRERLPASGNLNQIKALLELRLSSPVHTDAGHTVVVQTKTQPGEATARRFVVMV